MNRMLETILPRLIDPWYRTPAQGNSNRKQKPKKRNSAHNEYKLPRFECHYHYSRRQTPINLPNLGTRRNVGRTHPTSNIAQVPHIIWNTDLRQLMRSSHELHQQPRLHMPNNMTMKWPQALMIGLEPEQRPSKWANCQRIPAERIRCVEAVIGLPGEIARSGGHRALRHDPELMTMEMEGVRPII
jgi:hypothetical protein